MLKRIPLLVLLAAALAGLLSAQTLDTASIEHELGRPGQQTGNVYKVSFPRTDLHVRLQGVALRPGLALGSWAAFTPRDNETVMMGDLVLLPREVNPVMARLRQGGIDITALHNHLLGETPHVMYMHYMGHGPAPELARNLKAALALTGTPLGAPAPAAHEAEAAFVSTVNQILGRKGTWKSGVLSFGIPRAEPVHEHGAEIPPAMGTAESINLQSAGAGRVATTGDFVLTAGEVNPVISALQAHHIQVEAIHNHMLDEEPRLFFLHFWGVGQPTAIAQGLKDALSHVHTK